MNDHGNVVVTSSAAKKNTGRANRTDRGPLQRDDDDCRIACTVWIFVLTYIEFDIYYS